jgi:hypothetical protein
MVEIATSRYAKRYDGLMAALAQNNGFTVPTLTILGAMAYPPAHRQERKVIGASL